MNLLENMKLENDNGLCTINTLSGIPLYLFHNKKTTQMKQIIDTIINNYECDYVQFEKIKFYCGGINRCLTDNDMSMSLYEFNIPVNFDITMLNDDITKNVYQKSAYKDSKNVYQKSAYKDSRVAKHFKQTTAVWTGQIFVKTLNGKTITIESTSSQLVFNLKQVVCEREDCSHDTIRLICLGSQLEDDCELVEYGIKPEYTIHMCLRLRGGMYQETSGKAGNYQPLKSVAFFIGCDSDDFKLKNLK